MAVVALAYGVVIQRSLWYPVNLLAAVAMPEMAQAGPAELRAFDLTALSSGSSRTALISMLAGLLYAVILPMLARRHMLWGGLVAPLLWTGVLWAVLGLDQPGPERARGLGLVHRVPDRLRPRRGVVVCAGRAHRDPADLAPRRARRHRRRRARPRAREPRTAEPASGPRGARRCVDVLASPAAMRCPGTRRRRRARSCPPRSWPSTRSTRRNCAGCHGADGRLGAAAAAQRSRLPRAGARRAAAHDHRARAFRAPSHAGLRAERGR